MFFSDDEFIDVLSVFRVPASPSPPTVALGRHKLATLRARLGSAASPPAILYFAPAIYRIDEPLGTYGFWEGDLVIPSRITTWISPGAILDVSSGSRVVIDGPLNAEPVQIFRERSAEPQARLDGQVTEGMIILGGPIDAVLPEWWGATGSGVDDDRDALQRAFDASAPRRQPWLQGAPASQGRFRPRLPVRLSRRYRIGGTLVVGKEIAPPRDAAHGIQPVTLGQIGTTSIDLEGLSPGARGAATGLVVSGRFEGDAMVELRFARAATLQDLSLDAGGVAERCVTVLGTGTASANAVSIRRCRFTGARNVLLQLGTPAAPTTSSTFTVRDVNEALVRGANERGGPEPLKVALKVPRERQPEPGGDLVGLFIEDCLFELPPIEPVPRRLPRAIEFRAANAVATRIANCRFRGTAATFFDALAGTALLEGCDFDNRHLPAPRIPVAGVERKVKDGRVLDLGGLGFEPPDGADVYLRTDSFPLPLPEHSGVSTAVAISGCVSRSAMVLDTVRPSLAIGARPDRCVWLCGILHAPMREPAEPTAPSVRWGRPQVSRPLPSMGRSITMTGEPSLSIVGAALNRGVTVYYGAMQSLMIGVNSVGPNGERVRFEYVRPLFARRTQIFGLRLLTALLFLMGCTRSSGSTTRTDVVVDVLADDHADAVRPDVVDVASPDDIADVFVPNDAAMDAAPDVPADVPPPPPPIQQRRSCPASAEGDPTIPAPRLIFPMSPMRVTSRRPTLLWELPVGVTGARIELCRDPCCAQPIATLDANGSSARPTEMLPPGVVFWRARGRAGDRVGRETSFTWEFGVKRSDAPTDTAWGTIKDFNGDGYDDVVTTIASARGGYFRVYWGGSDGITPIRQETVQVPNGINGIAVGDFDGDGAADLVTEHSTRAPDDLTSSELRTYTYRDGRFQSTSGPFRVRRNGAFAVTDVNGDGFSDMALWSQSEGDVYPRASRWKVEVRFGSPHGLQMEAFQRLDNPIQVEPGGSVGQISASGDLNGDGYGDVVVADPDYRSRLGRLLVLPGDPGGLAQARVTTLNAPRDATGGAYFGEIAEGIGDVNGDRLGDLLATEGNRATTNVVLGDAVDHLRLDARIEYQGEYSRPSGGVQGFGGGTGNSPDLNGDGIGDVLVGCKACTGVDAGVGSGELTRYGRIYVYSRDRSGQMVIRQEIRGFDDWEGGGVLALGVVLTSAGDVNGDGIDDLVYVYSQGIESRPSRIVLQSGSLDWDTAVSTVILGDQVPSDAIAGTFGYLVALGRAREPRRL